MRKLFSINLHEPALKAERLMAAQKPMSCQWLPTQTSISALSLFPTCASGLPSSSSTLNQGFEVMSSPVVAVEAHASLSDLLLLAAETGVDHIVVRDGQESAAGVVHTKEIPQALFQTQCFMENQIKKRTLGR